MKNKIRRRCKCGCGKITNPGMGYIRGHNAPRKGTGKTKIRRKCKCGCGGVTKPGNKYIHGHHTKGKQSDDHKLKNSISSIKYNPNYDYCDIWKNTEYKKDLRKDYCENKNCRGNYKRLVNHHIDLDKKNCLPSNIMTLCNGCHISLHRKLQYGKKIKINPKDFLIINKSDHVFYINKRTRNMIKLQRVEL